MASVQALWQNGSIQNWNTTYLSSENGGGMCASDEFIDLSDVDGIGIILTYRAFPFSTSDMRQFAAGSDEEKILIPHDKVPDLVRLKIDGEVVLARVSFDDEGKPYLDYDGTLTHMLLPHAAGAAAAEGGVEDADSQDGAYEEGVGLD